MQQPLTTPRRLGATILVGLALAATVLANGPGRGKTAAFEQEYLQFIIDHHFSALRMTELAAGTDDTRDATISPAEGTAPSPNFPTVRSKSSLDQIKSLARRANQVQREEILSAVRMLREWYGVTYQPRIRAENVTAIQTLESAAPGADFDRAFLVLFPRHHFTAGTSSLECLAGHDQLHDDLRRYCRGILESQLNDIDEMRSLLCQQFNVCDLLPFDKTTASQH